MNRLREGWDYLLYRIYIWGGIAALVVYFAVVTYFRALTIGSPNFWAKPTHLAPSPSSYAATASLR